MSKITVILDSHQLSEYQQCPKKYWFSNIRHITPAAKIKRGLSRGDVFHEALKEYYDSSNGGHIATNKIIEIASKIQEIQELDDEERMFLSSRFLQYSKHYKGKDWNTIIATEKGFSKVLYESTTYRFIYEGKIDLIVGISGEKVWVDHKTRLYKYTRNVYDNQFLGYSWALGCTTGIVNYITMTEKEDDKTFERQPCAYSLPLIDKWRNNAIRWYKRLALSYIRASAESEEYDSYPEVFSACDTKYGICQFQPICIRSRNRFGAEMIIEREYKEKEPWKPW
jgi:hypothetical protein